MRFESTRAVAEFRESELVGPGFSSVGGGGGGGGQAVRKLRAGQIVYVTHSNREVQGCVLHHRPNLDQVIIQILVSRMRLAVVLHTITVRFPVNLVSPLLPC